MENAPQACGCTGYLGGACYRLSYLALYGGPDQGFVNFFAEFDVTHARRQDKPQLAMG